MNPPNRRFELVAFFAPLALYLATLVPTIHLGDSGELTLGASLLAIPHVPGYPLLATVGHLISQLPLGHLAWRGNFLSALGGALAVWAAYRLFWSLTGRPRAALAAALALACSFTLWEQSLKIRAYPLNTLFAALVWWLAHEWRQTWDRRFLYAAALVFGLGLANHEILLVVASVPLAWMIAHRRQLRWGDWLAAAAFAALGVSVYLYLPIRALSDPALNWGDPSSVPRLLDVLLQRQYAHKMLNPDWGAKWEMLGLIARSYVTELGPAAFALALAGWLGIVRRDAPLAIGMLALVAANAGLRINYIGEDEMFQVRRYLISSYLVFAAGLAVCLATLERAAVERARTRRAAVAYNTLLVLLIAWPAAAHYRANQQRGNWVAHETWQNALSHPEPRYALFVGGDNDVFPLWYLQLGERRREEVAVLPRAGFRADWVVNMMGAKLPPDTVRLRPEYRRADFADPLFLSTAANLLAQDALPVAFVFDQVDDAADNDALQTLRAAAQPFAVGGLVWWRNAAYDPTFDAWRLYQLAALSDPALVRDHHTRVLSRNTSVFLDRRARQCEALGRIDDAQDAYRRALVADPANDATMANFGNLLARLGRFDEAIAWYRQALAVNPREPRHHANLAIILEAAGKPDDAARARREALTGTSP